LPDDETVKLVVVVIAGSAAKVLAGELASSVAARRGALDLSDPAAI
jgi:hypothetical protein